MVQLSEVELAPSVKQITRSPRKSPARGKTSFPGWRLTPYLFLAPFFLLFGVFVLTPIVAGLWTSLHSWTLGLPATPWVGLSNYVDIFAHDSVLSIEFWKGMKATGIFTLFSVPLLITIPFVIALLLNQKFRGRTFFRAAFFAPYVLGVAVIGLLWQYMLDKQSGLINQLLGGIGLPSDIAWTTSLPAAWIALIGVTVWWTVGFNTVIYLAALQDVPPELHEAAMMDGAGAWRRFWNITVPSTRRVIQFVLVNTIIASANMYGQSALVTQQGPGTSTRTAVGFIAETGMQSFDIGNSSTMSLVLAVFMMAASGLVLTAFRRVGGSE